MKTVSVVIPAHNEEDFIGECLASIRQAETLIDYPVEIVVCLNRCCDATESIAKSYGAVLVTDESEANVAKVRNVGLQACTGDYIVTLDADGTLSPSYLKEVVARLDSGRYVVGAGLMFPKPLNFAAIVLGIFWVFPSLLYMRFSAATFWMTRKVFEDTQGFPEQYMTGEDFHYWRTLRKYAKAEQKPFGMILKAYITTSTRKCKDFGSWWFITKPHWFYYAIKGNNRAFADHYMYKPSRSKKYEEQ